MSGLTEIEYSDKYTDDKYEYRHVRLPEATRKQLPTFDREVENPLLTEAQWRAAGVQQSLGWVHYAWYTPEPWVLLFRRPLPRLPLSSDTTPTSTHPHPRQTL